jgi:hypothetical protein
VCRAGVSAIARRFHPLTSSILPAATVRLEQAGRDGDGGGFSLRGAGGLLGGVLVGSVLVSTQQQPALCKDEEGWAQVTLRKRPGTDTKMSNKEKKCYVDNFEGRFHDGNITKIKARAFCNMRIDNIPVAAAAVCRLARRSW